MPPGGRRDWRVRLAAWSWSLAKKPRGDTVMLSTSALLPTRSKSVATILHIPPLLFELGHQDKGSCWIWLHLPTGIGVSLGKHAELKTLPHKTDSASNFTQPTSSTWNISVGTAAHHGVVATISETDFPRCTVFDFESPVQPCLPTCRRRTTAERIDSRRIISHAGDSLVLSTYSGQAAMRTASLQPHLERYKLDQGSAVLS